MFDKKLDTDPYLDRLLASDPELHNELLLEFLKWPQTNQALTLHEATPVEILRRILGGIKGVKPYWATAALSHPNCPPELIMEKLKTGSDDELLALTRNRSLNDDQVRVLAMSSYSPILTWVCRRPDCPPDILEESFSICLKQWEVALERMRERGDVDNSATIFDDDLLFGEFDDQNGFLEVDKDLLEAIAANSNTPDQVFKKMMTMDLRMEWFDNGSLGKTLLLNPSVAAEDRAFLALQGFTNEVTRPNQVTSMVEHHGLPSSMVFQISKFPKRFKEALNSVGHPLAVLDPDLDVSEHEYSFNEIVNEWIKHETIYRTLWPELSERGDIHFNYRRSSYDGDFFYFSHKDLNLEHDFSRGSYGYNSMGYPFVDRAWAVTAEHMSIEMSYENFSSRDMIDFFEGDDEDMYDHVLASVISQNSYEGEVTTYSSSGETKRTVKAQYSLTKKGEKFVCDSADSYFSEDADVEVNLFPEKALPDSWKALSGEKKDLITRIIIEGFHQKVDTKYQYAEHFLACIALHPNTPDSIRQSMSGIESTIIQQALGIGNGKRKEN
jgi:hypothetical protein